MTAGGPFFQVVAGHPSDEEVAALTVALLAVRAARERATHELAARARPARAHASRAAGHWADRAGLLRSSLAPGPGAWRRSANVFMWQVRRKPGWFAQDRTMSRNPSANLKGWNR